MTVPVSILWGALDPWEKVEWGREFKQYDSVEEFIELEGADSCICFVYRFCRCRLGCGTC